MARSKTPTNTREFNFTPNNGVLTGWLAIALGVGGLVWAAMNPHTAVGVRLGVGSGLLMLVAYAFLLRPRIKVTEGVLLLVNPLEDVSMPLSIVDKVVVRSTTRVYVGEKNYSAVAVGRKVRHMTGNSRPRPDQIPDLLEEWVYQLVKDAKLEPPEAADAVRRTPAWWLIAPLVTLAFALVLAFVG
ncbi:MAG: hypothetical protein ABI873_01905 [Marmoricola sp.]